MKRHTRERTVCVFSCFGLCGAFKSLCTDSPKRQFCWRIPHRKFARTVKDSFFQWCLLMGRLKAHKVSRKPGPRPRGAVGHFPSAHYHGDTSVTGWVAGGCSGQRSPGRSGRGRHTSCRSAGRRSRRGLGAGRPVRAASCSGRPGAGSRPGTAGSPA